MAEKRKKPKIIKHVIEVENIDSDSGEDLGDDQNLPSHVIDEQDAVFHQSIPTLILRKTVMERLL